MNNTVEIVVGSTRLSDGPIVYSVRVVQGENSIDFAAASKRGAWILARSLKSAMGRSIETVGEIIEGYAS